MTMTSNPNRLALAPGTMLSGYRVLDVLGTGGFGVTYLVEELPHSRLAAIKEYLPSEVAVRDGNAVVPRSNAATDDFEWGLVRFMDEAKTLEQFQHDHVVGVDGCFRGNGTAYIVMDYEDGKPLNVLLERYGILTEKQLRHLLLPLLDGLRTVHSRNFLHRDIKPSNIYVRRSDGSPVLLDFGAARQAVGHRSRKVTALVTPGYSPPEQYERNGEAQGPWSDIYAMAAVCFQAITGKKPAPSPSRQRSSGRGSDPVAPLAEEASGHRSYSIAMLRAVDWGLRLGERERPQDVGEWLRAIEGYPRPTRRTNATAETMPTMRADEPASEAARAVPALRLLVGRGQDADVTLAHASVSRLHVELVVPQASMSNSATLGYVVEDQGSRNGTFVFRGGRWERILKEVVRGGDPLRLGDYETSAETLVAMGMERWEEDDSLPPEPSEDALGDFDHAYVRVRRNPRSGEVVGE